MKAFLKFMNVERQECIFCNQEVQLLHLYVRQKRSLNIASFLR